MSETGDAQHQIGHRAAFAARTTADPERIRAFAIESARMMLDDKCEDVVILDVTKLSQVTDYIVIATGTSDRQMRSVLEHVEELGDRSGMPAFRTSKDAGTAWLLGDFVDVVVHVFEPNARAHYDLELLWGDAPRVPFAREEPDSADGGET